MSIPEWVPTVLMGTAMAVQVALAVDRWVHKNTSDTSSLSGDLGRLVKTVDGCGAKIEQLEAGQALARDHISELRAEATNAKEWRTDRARQVDAELKRIESTVAQNHAKAMAQDATLDGLLDVWATKTNEQMNRIVAIETWLDRPVRKATDHSKRD